jgi:hypothetical protein
MSVVEEKNRRLAEWHENLSGTLICGSLHAWLRTQLAEVDAMRTDGLIDAGEARELRKLADAAHTVLMGLFSHQQETTAH